MVPYTLIRSRRRTLSMEITPDCQVLVRAPARMPKEEIEDFVASRQDWIAKHLPKVRAQAALMPPDPTPAELDALFDRAMELLPPKVEHWAAVTGLRPTGVTITDARSRYGSCSAKNRIALSCFLVNYPEDFVDLVVVHELCHIREKNHGPRFYALLERFLPDWRERKKLPGSPAEGEDAL